MRAAGLPRRERPGMSARVRFHETLHGVYFDDLDAFQILHNARYLLFVEHTIGSFWRAMGWSGVLDFNSNPDQYHFVRANHLEYHRPMVGTGQLRVRVWIERLGTSSLTFGFRLLPMDEDKDYASGTRVIVRVDPQHKRPVAWSEELKQKLAPYRRDLDAP